MGRSLVSAEAEATGDYAAHAIRLGGHSLLLDRSGVLIWPGRSTLIVTDLHLEKGSSAARRGRLLPPYDTRDTLVRLAAVMDAYEPATVICLGDSFHDAEGPLRLGNEDLKILSILQDGREWIWVTGNHDPEISGRVGGNTASRIDLDGVTLRHEPRAGPVSCEIAGHLHPAAKIAIRGACLRRPCFVGNQRRLILPAFGSFTGGLNVLDDAFAPLFGHDGFYVWLRGEDGLYPVSTRHLRSD